MHKDSHKWPKRKPSLPDTRRIVRINTASNYICPRCREQIMHDRHLDEYFCWHEKTCGFRETRDEYKLTLRDINLTQQREKVAQRAVVERTIADGKSRVAARRSQLGPVVYYIQFRDAIKIGTAIDPKHRLSSLPWESVLAMEPGGYEVEASRHRQFMELRLSGEWFYDKPSLRDHIAQINDANQDWRTARFPDLSPFPWVRGEVVIPGIAANDRDDQVAEYPKYPMI